MESNRFILSSINNDGEEVYKYKIRNIILSGTKIGIKKALEKMGVKETNNETKPNAS